MADRRGASANDRGKLLDVATQPRHQPRPSCLASGAPGHGALGMFCSRERSRLPLYAARIARGRHWHIESPAQRGRQRRGVAVSDLRGAARSVSRSAAWGVSSIPSTQPPAAFSRGLRRSSFNRTAIQPPPSNWLCSNSKTCVSSRRLRLLFSTPFGWRPC